MNPRDRFLGTLRGKKAIRVPMDLEGFRYGTEEELEREPDSLRRDIARRVFGEMAVGLECPSRINRYLITPPQFIEEVDRDHTADGVRVTSEIETPKGPLTAVTVENSLSDTTWIEKYPVESLDDVDRIRSVRWELPVGLAPPDLSEPPADFDERRFVRTNVSSPFVCVAGMMPFQYFLELCATEFDLIRDLTAECLDRTLQILDVVLADETVEYVWMGGSEWLTPPMASPQLYEELVQAFEAAVIERCHQAGALCHVHCHGNVRSTLERVIERGADLFEPVEPPPDGDITFAEAKALTAGRMTLGGNVEARILSYGTPDDVEQAARAAFDGGKEHMVFRTSVGPISDVTPTEHRNYHRLLDVWEELSPT